MASGWDDNLTTVWPQSATNYAWSRHFRPSTCWLMRSTSSLSTDSRASSRWHLWNVTTSRKNIIFFRLIINKMSSRHLSWWSTHKLFSALAWPPSILMVTRRHRRANSKSPMLMPTNEILYHTSAFCSALIASRNARWKHENTRSNWPAVTR